MTEEADVYICGICKKEFQDFVTFLQHKSSFGVFKCKLCNLSYHDREDIQEHINASHNNQKVDVVFTIPTKSNIVSTRTEPVDDAAESQKPGYTLSVYTCRLCNRFTLAERSMFQHLQNVHKIHVKPGSVELAALMLCSKPLDASSIPRLTGGPVVVKTVTAPVISKPVSTVVTSAIGTQTKLSSANIATVATIMDGADRTGSGAEQCIEWVELAEAETQEVVVVSTDNTTPLSEVELTEAIDSQSVKMTSILKPNTTATASPRVKTESLPNVVVAAQPVQILDAEQVVCIDGGHDYISNADVKRADVSADSYKDDDCDPLEPKIDDVSAMMELEDDIDDEPDDDDECAEVILFQSPKKYAGRKPASSSGPSRPAVLATTVAKRGGAVKSATKRPAMKSISRPSPHSTVKRQMVIKSDDSDIEDEEEDEEPQPGADGMYHCRKCSRAFARERQFKAHMNVHILYGEHYLESPGGGSRYESKSSLSHRKKAKLE